MVCRLSSQFVFAKDSGFFSNTEKRLDDVALSSGRMLAKLAESSRHKRASGQEQRIQLLLSWKLRRIFLEL
jgi:hypothetical protein